MATLDLGQVVGKSAYAYAVDGGYTGTEEEFQALMAGAATKTYVDGLFNQVAPVIVKVQLLDSSDSVLKSYNVKCYPAETGISSYSINFSPGGIVQTLNPGNVKIIPPEQYAFTGLYWSSGIVLDISNSNVDYVANGMLQNDGTILFQGFPIGSEYRNWVITGSFTLEVA